MNATLVFALMFATAAFVLTLALTLPTLGESGVSRRRLLSRLHQSASNSQSEIKQLIRQKKLEGLGPLAAALEQSHLTNGLRQLIEHAGSQRSVAAILLWSVVVALALAVLAFLLSKTGLFAVGAFVLGLTLPTFKLIYDRNKRIESFEERLPDAIDIMKRAIQAGYPFTESMRVVADEMDGPVAAEFGITFMDINYGAPLSDALNAMLERMPSTTLMALVTSVVVQKETGGRLTEILERINHVVRGRTKFQRKVKTLSSEGRFSAWVLAMMPFVLVVMLQLTSPNYIQELVSRPEGRKMVLWAFVGMLAGIFWMRQIIRIKV